MITAFEFYRGGSPLNAEIIAIGTELLMGELVDTNSAYLATELGKLGIRVGWMSKVGDDLDRLAETIERSWSRSDITITSGGLGPTSDDLTRESIAVVMGEAMEVQPNLLEHLEGIFAGRGAPMPATNIKQATLIPSASTVPNPMGTAPGWWVEREGRVIVAMPGPPREVQQMWSGEVAARLRAMVPNIAIVTRTLKTFGISEGGLDEMLSPLFAAENPSLGIYAKPDGIHLRAIATSPTEDEARALIKPVEAHIRGIVGDSIWGVDDETPESQVVSLLLERGLTLASMESLTAGLLAGRLANAVSGDRVLKGGLIVLDSGQLENQGVKSEALRMHGPVSAETAEAMASAARDRFEADVGVGVTGVSDGATGSEGPPGTAYMGFAVGARTFSASGTYPTHPSRVRARAVTNVLLELGRVLRGSTLS